MLYFSMGHFNLRCVSGLRMGITTICLCVLLVGPSSLSSLNYLRMRSFHTDILGQKKNALLIKPKTPPTYVKGTENAAPWHTNPRAADPQSHSHLKRPASELLLLLGYLRRNTMTVSTSLRARTKDMSWVGPFVRATATHNPSMR